jgi:putative transposase
MKTMLVNSVPLSQDSDLGQAPRCSIARGERHLRQTIQEYVAHYHAERNHQSLGNKLIAADDNAAKDGRAVRRQRLGGVLNFYHRRAA